MTTPTKTDQIPGNHFRIMRESAGMSRRLLSTLTKVSRTTLKEYEDGKNHKFHINTYLKLINALEAFKTGQI